MGTDRAARIGFTTTLIVTSLIVAWGILSENPYMFVAGGLAMLSGIGVLLGSILSVLVDIRDQTRGKKDE